MVFLVPNGVVSMKSFSGHGQVGGRRERGGKMKRASAELLVRIPDLIVFATLSPPPPQPQTPNPKLQTPNLHLERRGESLSNVQDNRVAAAGG